MKYQQTTGDNLYGYKGATSGTTTVNVYFSGQRLERGIDEMAMALSVVSVNYSLVDAAKLLLRLVRPINSQLE